ncbi:MAG: hypothetical protein H6736_25255 [Alphaproteobacteria bacterium]|nr:hypothetical protein [Alphaproteobacteria bacterium]MCB9695127.1 hypothetical protein [Alphaproteobacteria bacterium]
MRVTHRIGLSLLVGTFTLGLSLVLAVESAWTVREGAARMELTLQQLSAIQAVEGAAAAQRRAILEGRPVDDLLDRRMADLARVGAEEEEADGFGLAEDEGKLHALRGLNERVERGSREALATRARLLDAWHADEREEVRVVVRALEADLTQLVHSTAVVVLVGAGGLFFLTSTLLISVRRGFDRLALAAERLGRGEFDAPVRIGGWDEFAVLGAGLNTAMADLGAARADIDRLDHALTRRNEDLTVALEDARTAQQVAEDASRAKDAFLANMSHELRTPLNAILGYTELIREELLDLQHPAVRDCERVLDSGNLLLRLISDVLDVSKLAAGKVELAPTRIALRPFFDELHGTLEPLARRTGSVLRFDVDVDGDVEIDGLRLRQILLNLGSNACKFTKEGLVVVDAWRVGEDLVISVRDTGIGMRPEQLEVIFQPFVQGDASTTREFGGTGLGLAIVHRLVDLMDGEIHATSEEGRGTRFDVRLRTRWLAREVRASA